MTVYLLSTKLYLPPFRPDHISRTRLIEKLNAGRSRKLILISAPAGFGKTTLLSSWIAGLEQPTAWLSLDEGDNDLTRFLTSLVALQLLYFYISQFMAITVTLLQLAILLVIFAYRRWYLKDESSTE